MYVKCLLTVSTVTMKLDAVSCAEPLCKLLTSCLLQYLGSINQHVGLFSGEGEFYLLKVSTLTIKLDAISCATPLCKLLTSCLLQYLGSTNQHAGLFSGEAELNCKSQIL
jgi:hypothetical protein